jgi:transposase-like protein
MSLPVDLIDLMDSFGTYDRCQAALEGLRWPDGPRCPRCQSPKLSRIYKRDQFDCDSCGYQFSVTAGTIFHDTHLPLRKWFLAVYVMTESRKGVSANQLKRMLGVSYKTAWYLCHRIRSAMAEAQPRPLTGVVETDETYLGGKPRRKAGHPQHGETFDTERRREASQAWHRNKTIVLGAVERGGEVRLQMVPHARKGNVMGFLTNVVDDHAAAIYSDEFRSYDEVGDADTVHAAVNHRAGEWARGDVHTNTIESVWSLLDRAIMGSYHKLSVKHLPAYLQEFEWRFNNRENPYLFRDTLTRLISAAPLAYKELVAVG